MQILNAFLEENRLRLCTLLQELVRVPTVNPPGSHYPELVQLLDEKCRELGMETVVVPVPVENARQVVPHAERYPRSNLIARWRVGAAKTVHFNAHYDVVPVSGGWRSGPFEGNIQGDWLYGRGADDMKDAIAALLLAIAALRETHTPPGVNIECSFTCDEEIGGDLGAGFLAQQKMIHADYVVNCEGGSGLDVGCGHNGVLWLEIIVHGKAAHAASPNDGLNAFEKMTELVQALQPLKKRFDAPERRFTTPSGGERQPTLNIGGVFFGTEGDKVNTVPAQATFTIDRRILPNETLEHAERELRAAIEEARTSIPDLRVDVRRTLGIEPCQVAHDDPFVQAFARAVRVVRRQPVRFNLTRGFTDLHFLVEGGRRPGVGYGPRGERGHGADERVRISDMMQTAKIYAQFLAQPGF